MIMHTHQYYYNLTYDNIISCFSGHNNIPRFPLGNDLYKYNTAACLEFRIIVESFSRHFIVKIIDRQHSIIIQFLYT